MNLGEPAVLPNDTLSVAARRRLMAHPGEPLLIAAWERVLMIHFEVDAESLQRDVPYELDLWDDHAFVSLVAFTMRGMRPRAGGRLAAWLLRPIATHDFLNVRTYVRHEGEAGIHFLAEWLSNRLAVALGPRIFGLPYRFGKLEYGHDWRSGRLCGRVADARTGAVFAYCAKPKVGAWHGFAPCPRESLDEWLMERYTAFNGVPGRKIFFRIWHPPWTQAGITTEISEASLAGQNWSWFDGVQLISSNYSPGFQEVWMGQPHRTG